MHDAVGDLGRLRVVADDDGRRALLTRELRQQAVDDHRARGVELAGGLVGDQEPRPVGEGSAQRDALLFAAGQLAGQRSRAVVQTDALEELAGAGSPRRLWYACEAERYRDQLLRGELAGERAPVVLVGIAERPRPVVAQSPARHARKVDAVDDDRAGARALQPCENPHQRRLAGPAGAQHDADLALLHAQRQSLKSCHTTLGGRVDAKEITGVDDVHASASCARSGPR